LKGITRILTELEKITSGMTSTPLPILYVPGNHDPASMFLSADLGKPKLTDYSTNIHKEFRDIREDLAIMGLGGSVPSYFLDYTTGEKSPIYFPYPYQSEEDVNKDLTSLFSQIAPEK
jgi:DNA repair exonuclease SbcCD nuclease subunit